MHQRGLIDPADKLADFLCNLSKFFVAIILVIERESRDHGRDTSSKRSEISIDVGDQPCLHRWNLHDFSGRRIDTDPSEKPTCCDSNESSLTDPADVHRLRKRPVLISDQSSWDAGREELVSHKGRNVRTRLNLDHCKRRLGQLRKVFIHDGILPAYPDSIRSSEAEQFGDRIPELGGRIGSYPILYVRIRIIPREGIRHIDTRIPQKTVTFKGTRSAL
jgi:hypothetical protein